MHIDPARGCGFTTRPVVDVEEVYRRAGVRELLGGGAPDADRRSRHGDDMVAEIVRHVTYNNFLLGVAWRDQAGAEDSSEATPAGDSCERSSGRSTTRCSCADRSAAR